MHLYIYVCIIFRQTGQNTAEELKNKDFRRELEEKERIAAHDREGKRASRGNIYIYWISYCVVRIYIV